MNRTVEKVGASLMIAFALAGLGGCSEKPEDVARKPDVIETLVKKSMQSDTPCEISKKDTPEAYEMRLRTVLKDVWTKDLETLVQKNVQICPDTRLPVQKDGGFLERTIIGVHYNADPKNPVLTIWDNGKVGKSGSFWVTDTDDYGSGIVERLAEKYQAGEVSADQAFNYAGRFNCGKNCMTTKIRSVEYFQGAVEKNPQLSAPPLTVKSSSLAW